MSIRNFSTQPCVKCGCDTTHVASACRVCGTVALTNREVRKDFYIRRFKQLEEKHGTMGARQAVNLRATRVAIAKAQYNRQNGIRAQDFASGAFNQQRKAGK